MARLGIQGLPAPIESLADGGLYGLTCDLTALRVPILARSIESSLIDGHRVVVATSVDVTGYLKRVRLAGCDLSGYARQGRLHLVRQKSDAEGPGLDALKRLLAELRYFKLPARSLLVIDLADELLPVTEPALLRKSVEMIDQWAEPEHHVVLLAFSLSGLGSKGVAHLKACSERFAGFAVVRQAEDDALLAVRHWFGPRGQAARGSFALTTASDGLVHARATTSGSRLSIDQGREDHVVTRRASQDFGSQASHWKVAASTLDALEMLRQSLAATVVLHFDRQAELKELCQAVAAIRAFARPQIRIVVRECGARLRTGQMVALFRLGVSVIIPQSLSGTAARLMAESLDGSLMTRSVETDVRRALAESRVELRPGPMGVADFKRAVESLLAAASEMDLPCTLVIMNPQTALASRAAMSAIKRALRDAVHVESDDGIWIFLFGCAPESAQTVMTRLLGARFENLLMGWQRFSGAREIMPALGLLADGPPGDLADGRDMPQPGPAGVK